MLHITGARASSISRPLPGATLHTTRARAADRPSDPCSTHAAHHRRSGRPHIAVRFPVQHCTHLSTGRRSPLRFLQHSMLPIIGARAGRILPYASRRNIAHDLSPGRRSPLRPLRHPCCTSSVLGPAAHCRTLPGATLHTPEHGSPLAPQVLIAFHVAHHRRSGRQHFTVRFPVPHCIHLRTVRRSRLRPLHHHVAHHRRLGRQRIAVRFPVLHCIHLNTVRRSRLRPYITMLHIIGARAGSM